MICLCTPDELAEDIQAHAAEVGTLRGVQMHIDQNPKPYKGNKDVMIARPTLTVEHALMGRAWRCEGMTKHLQDTLLRLSSHYIRHR